MSVRWRVHSWRSGQVMARARAGILTGTEDAAKRVARRAAGLTPWETGHLRASQEIRRESHRGAAVVYTADYAAIVHEVPPNSGGRWGTGYKHKAPTQYKFLERATHEESRGVLDDIGAALRRAFGRGR